MQTRRDILGALAAAPAGRVAAGGAETASQMPLTAKGLSLAAGVHRIDANVTVKADLLVSSGAEIHVAAGKTLTVLGDFQAPVSHVFYGNGRVDMQNSRAPAAFPEWWGAVRDDPSTDCQPALRACVEAHPVSLLGAGDYYVADTWKITMPNRRIWGAGRRGIGSGRGTRIVVTAPDRDVVQIGTSEKPPGPNFFLRNVDFRYIDLARTAAAVDRDALRGPAGLKVRFVLDCHFEAVSACEQAVGFSLVGAVRSFLIDCEAFFSAGVPGQFCGFHLDGRTDIGLAGGNASIYIQNCNVTAGGPATARPGLGAFLQGAFADTYLQNFETSAVATGILVDGIADLLSAPRRRTGHADLHVTMPILDQCSRVGLELANLSDYALVDVLSPYIAPAPAAIAAFSWHNCSGLVSVNGGQFVGWVNASAGGSAVGLHGSHSQGINISGLKLLEFSRPVLFEDCSDFDIVAAINNPGHVSSEGAVRFHNCQHGYIRPRVKGRSAAFPAAVDLQGLQNRALTIDVTGIDPTALSGGPGNRVRFEHVSAQPSFESNVVVVPGT